MKERMSKEEVEVWEEEGRLAALGRMRLTPRDFEVADGR